MRSTQDKNGIDITYDELTTGTHFLAQFFTSSLLVLRFTVKNHEHCTFLSSGKENYPPPQKMGDLVTQKTFFQNLIAFQFLLLIKQHHFEDCFLFFLLVSRFFSSSSPFWRRFLIPDLPPRCSPPYHYFHEPVDRCCCKNKLISFSLFRLFRSPLTFIFPFIYK